MHSAFFAAVTAFAIELDRGPTRDDKRLRRRGRAHAQSMSGVS